MTDDFETGAVIIELPKRNAVTPAPATRLLAKRRSYPDRQCRACHLLLDEKTHGVTCKDCGQNFEPFAALMHLARTPEAWRAEVMALRHEKDRLTKQRDALKHEVQLLKAQKRRATP